MHVLRPIRENDLPKLVALAGSISGGLTTLPQDAAFLEGKIDDSLRAFRPRIKTPGAEHYLFALEDTATGELAGTAGLVARVGGFDPFYSYEIRRERITHAPLGISREIEVLHLKTDHKGPAEACSLFLRADRRHGGLGRLLSLGRFLFLAAFPRRFDAEIIAELRGYIDDAGKSPFWESVGRHFFEKDFYTADFLSGLGHKDFIHDLMPRHPIYRALLPPTVHAVIGRVHRDTEPALRLLAAEGFAPTGEVDIFDAGPMVRAAVTNIRTVRLAAAATVRALAGDAAAAPTHLLANPSLDFRATLGAIAAHDDGSVSLAAPLAAALQLEPGGQLLHAPLR